MRGWKVFDDGRVHGTAWSHGDTVTYVYVGDVQVAVWTKPFFMGGGFEDVSVTVSKKDRRFKTGYRTMQTRLLEE
jgi:hypothetical protein